MITFDFPISKTKILKISIPDLPEKFNYYYEPTEKLHEFDEATVTFIDQDSCLEINKDMLTQIVTVLHGTLKLLLANNLQIPKQVSPGSLGILLNNKINRVTRADLSNFWMWSSENNNGTLMYNSNDKIYMEIVPLYPWTFVDPNPGDSYISFDDFMKQYKYYAFEPISKETAIEWHNQCEKILTMIGIKIDS